MGGGGDRGSQIPSLTLMIWPLSPGQGPFFLSRGGPEPWALDPRELASGVSLSFPRLAIDSASPVSSILQGVCSRGP